MKIPRISTYGRYTSDNYGAHTMTVEVGDLTVYFSYKTPVAFAYPGFGIVVRSNTFSRTTGKHLNMIDGGKSDERVPGDAFEEALDMLIEGRVGDAKIALDIDHRIVHKAITGSHV